MDCIGIIPARFASSRFPGKPLVDILGKTMIARVWEQACKSKRLREVIIATDDTRIVAEALRIGAKVMLTRSEHPSGTDRCAEVAQRLELSPDAVVVNIQGDEPFIDPAQIDTLVSCFDAPEVELATLVKLFADRESLEKTSTIKVVVNALGDALYFSRAVIPFTRDHTKFQLEHFKQHIGIYGYRAETLARVANLPPSPLENAEMLEQLRWLENGLRIRTALSQHESWSVDTPEDLDKILKHFAP
jgi:3-deoxy-manno-octulosonate cytidylyltransferase (CMP-KDO synthetase)